ncbi:nicotinamide riboside transporter PnuC [Pseudobacteroides cellulosolvens]|uniref:Nicotinamide mononucleotide transporter PnuC n=1 Tax=Pseudobacteroides cellulosolvens ATCC 35603 = DSM 2933 TaxID=398512 RepID=A0A0L6JHH0_9FIRM|nr:nicotinamide riboside transporter PnuC [Pseudobacteroides cellulosolvens]KNY25168.1 nicotinamide mononucleotide transporter PnuC [Pseudobacteroides cellulosolvens ATCC 35603 = DSM 2933]
MNIKGWNLFEIIWLTVFSAIMLVLSFFWKTDVLGITVYLTGVMCVVLAAKGNVWNYIFGIYNSIGYAWISYQNKLFGEVMLNLLFYVPTGIIGWFMWKRQIDNGNTVIMRKMSWKGIVGLISLCIAATIGYGIWLTTFKGQNTPYLDAFIVVTSIIATLAMMFRFREQWFLYITINIAQIVMWGIRLSNEGIGAAAMTLMWIAYLVNSVYGLYRWSKGTSDTNLSKEDDKAWIA